MNRREMLAKMHISDEELKDLMKKFGAFFRSLSKDQQGVMRRSMLTLEQTAKTFGDDVTPRELMDELCDPDGVPGLCGCTAANGTTLPK